MATSPCSVDLFDLPADLDTPVGAYRKLAPLRPRFLLESVVGAETQARYSFIGLGDAREVRLRGRGIEVDGVERAWPEGEAVAAQVLRELLDEMPKPGEAAGLSADALPFQGGLVGACAFDLTRRLQRLPNQPPHTGDTEEAAFIGPRSVLVFDHATRRAAVLHDGPEAERQALRKEIRSCLRSGLKELTSEATYTDPQGDTGRDAFVDKVGTAKRAIRDGEVYQLVLSEGFSGRTSIEPLQAYRALRLLNPSPYMFLVELGETTLVGSSPEVLVATDGQAARLRPIAGTRPRGATPEIDLANERELCADPKELAEHVMLVDLARNDLGRVARPGSVAVTDDRIVERYSHVMHLVSGVEGQLEAPHDMFDLYASSFPAGTVTGAPKTRAMEWIERLEGRNRGFYGGTVGWFGHGGACDQALTIRTLAFRGDTYSYRAGAGIVDASIPENEHDEVLAKGRVLNRALQLAAEELR